MRLRQEEKLGPAAIARRLGIGRASVYRLLGQQAAVSANGGVDAEWAGLPAVAPWREMAAGYGGYEVETIFGVGDLKKLSGSWPPGALPLARCGTGLSDVAQAAFWSANKLSGGSASSGVN